MLCHPADSSAIFMGVLPRLNVPMCEVVLYSKPGCHLCEPVRDVILAMQMERQFDFEVRNIEDDPADFEKYKHAIPVVLVNGREIARHKLTRIQLETALRPPG